MDYSDLKQFGLPRLSSVSLEVTSACNLRCPHCFLPCKERHLSPRFLSIGRLETLLPTLARLGCRNIGLVGGEPFLHPDFAQILRLCRRAGLDVTLYSNGTLLNRASIQTLRRHPLRVLIVTFYAASDADYASLSTDGQQTLFSAITSGIQELARVRIPYKLQAFHSKLQPDLPAAIRLALPHERKIAVFWNVFPQSDRHRANQACMIDAEDVVLGPRRPQRNPRMEALRDYLYQQKAVYACPVPFTGVYITADFVVKPCIFVQDPEAEFSLDKYSFEEVFLDKLPSLMLRRISEKSPCYSCEMSDSCCRCAAHGYGTEWPDKGKGVICKMAKRVAQEVNRS